MEWPIIIDLYINLLMLQLALDVAPVPAVVYPEEHCLQSNPSDLSLYVPTAQFIHKPCDSYCPDGQSPTKTEKKSKQFTS